MPSRLRTCTRYFMSYQWCDDRLGRGFQHLIQFAGSRRLSIKSGSPRRTLLCSGCISNSERLTNDDLWMFRRPWCGSFVRSLGTSVRVSAGRHGNRRTLKDGTGEDDDVAVATDSSLASDREGSVSGDLLMTTDEPARDSKAGVWRSKQTTKMRKGFARYCKR